MKITGDYHLHTRASDGHTTVLNHIRVAEQKGLEQIAITDHSFDTFMGHLTIKKFDKQRQIINDYEGNVRVLHGVEGNLIAGEIDVPHSVIRRCDVLLLGFHRFISPHKMRGEFKFLFVNGFGSKRAKEKLIVKNTESYIAAMETYPIDILAHIGHRAPLDMARVFECAARKHVYVELNEKHLDTFENCIDCAIDAGVNFILGSDAHKHCKTGEFENVLSFVKRHNVPLDRIFGLNANMPVFKDKSGWQYDA